MLDVILLISLFLAVFIVWAEIMYYFAGKDNRWMFCIMLCILIFGTGVTTAIKLVTSTNALTIFFSAVLLFVIIFWGATLYEQAGNKQKSWYYLTLIIPLLAIVYHIVNNEK